MKTTRQHVAAAQSPGAYHIVNRCVRNAWLCGVDPHNGRDLSPRRRDIEARLYRLAESYSVAIYTFAVMSKQVHLVVQTDPAAPREWDDAEVLRRWFAVSRRDEAEEARRARIAESLADAALIARCRERLGNLSSFMRHFSEPVARAANLEDGCRGRFWEGRFHCRPLADDREILGALIHVDRCRLQIDTTRPPLIPALLPQMRQIPTTAPGG